MYHDSGEIKGLKTIKKIPFIRLSTWIYIDGILNIFRQKCGVIHAELEDHFLYIPLELLCPHYKSLMLQYRNEHQKLENNLGRKTRTSPKEHDS